MTDEQARMRARMLCDKIEATLRTAGHVTDGAVYGNGVVAMIARALQRAYQEGQACSLQRPRP